MSFNHSANGRESGHGKPTSGGSFHPSEAELIRCAADGELTADQESALRALLASRPEVAKAIEFERTLRTRVGEVMSRDGNAPAEVRAKVAQVLGRNDVVATIGAGRPRRRWVVRLAAAAVLVLAVSMIFIQPWRSRNIDLADRVSRVSLLAHVEREHIRCSELGGHFKSKMSVDELAPAEGFVEGYLHASIDSLDLSRVGYRFVAIGECSVPGGGRAVHGLYQAESDSAPLSLFVQQDTGSLQIDAGKCYVLAAPRPQDSPLAVWRDGSLIYYLVVPKDRPCGEVVAELGGPSEADVVRL